MGGVPERENRKSGRGGIITDKDFPGPKRDTSLQTEREPQGCEENHSLIHRHGTSEHQRHTEIPITCQRGGKWHPCEGLRIRLASDFPATMEVRR